jgi:F-type H+-transporting ATPase subunit c
MLPETGIAPGELAKAAKFIAMGLCMSIGGVGSALGQGFIGGKACEAVGKKPESVKSVSGVMMISLVAAESTTVFCFVVTLILFVFG